MILLHGPPYLDIKILLQYGAPTLCVNELCSQLNTVLKCTIRVFTTITFAIQRAKGKFSQYIKTSLVKMQNYIFMAYYSKPTLSND